MLDFFMEELLLLAELLHFCKGMMHLNLKESFLQLESRQIFLELRQTYLLVAQFRFCEF
jgi:hypothetical protein